MADWKSEMEQKKIKLEQIRAMRNNQKKDKITNLRVIILPTVLGMI